MNPLLALKHNLHTNNDQWLDILRGIRKELPQFLQTMAGMYGARSESSPTMPLGKLVHLDGYKIVGFTKERSRFSVVVDEKDPLYTQAIVDYLEVYNDIEASYEVREVAPLLIFHALSIAAGLQGMTYRSPEYGAYLIKTIDDTLDVLIRKNGDYSSAYRRHGIKGLNARLYDKLSRLINLLTKDHEPSYESTVDSALDLAGYSTILLGMTIEHNATWNSSLESVSSFYDETLDYMTKVHKSPLVVSNFKPLHELVYT